MRSVSEAASDWGVSESLVRKWIKQGRIEVQRFGPAGRVLLVLSLNRPTRAAYGSIAKQAVERKRESR